jgi:hypothetical protein
MKTTPMHRAGTESTLTPKRIVFEQRNNQNFSDKTFKQCIILAFGKQACFTSVLINMKNGAADFKSAY